MQYTSSRVGCLIHRLVTTLSASWTQKKNTKDMAKGGKARYVMTHISFGVRKSSNNSEPQNDHRSNDLDRPDGFLLHHETSPAEHSQAVRGQV